MALAGRELKFGETCITSASNIITRAQCRAIEIVSSINEVVVRKWWLNWVSSWK
jgi:hypothetical protein